MRLLLTRAEEDAARTRSKLIAAGHKVLLSPLLNIVATGAQWPGGVVDALVVTSGHAFDRLDDARGPTPEARRLLPLLLVGGRTEASARHHGFTGETLVAPSASALAEAIVNFSRKPNRTIYLAGLDRKPEVERALELAGWPADVLETYEARPAAHLPPRTSDAIRAGLVDGVLHFSQRSAELFATLAAKANVGADSLRHFCLSEDVAVPLRDANYRLLTIAETPTESALIATVANAAAVQA